MINARALLAVALVLLSGCSTPLSAPLESLSGAQLYERLCASCHGADGRGDGPVAAVLKTPVPDLTRIASRDGGEFPAEDVRRTIDGRFERPAHGSREMPVWGRRLYDASSDDASPGRERADVLIDRLVEHLRAMQI